jgi:hypothetical protein
VHLHGVVCLCVLLRACCVLSLCVLMSVWRLAAVVLGVIRNKRTSWSQQRIRAKTADHTSTHSCYNSGVAASLLVVVVPLLLLLLLLL